MHAQDVINGKLYARNLVARYRPHRALLPVETVVLERYRTACANRRILDLGCGTGRLAAHLLDLTPHYIGVDLSPYMIEHCRSTLPTTGRFAIGDMRALDLVDGSVDVVFAIANLIDAVSHRDRLRVLAELRRVLAPGGTLVFSSHNRRWIYAGTGPRLERAGNPLAQLRHLGEFLVARLNHQRIRRYEHATDEYALYNDSAHNYSLLHYYIDRETQARQLECAGFALQEVFDDERGTALDEDDDARDDASLLYVARRY